MTNSTLAQKVIHIIAQELEVIETNITLDIKLYLDVFYPATDDFSWQMWEMMALEGVFPALQRAFGAYDLFFLDRPDVSVRDIVAYLQETGCS